MVFEGSYSELREIINIPQSFRDDDEGVLPFTLVDKQIKKDLSRTAYLSPKHTTSVILQRWLHERAQVNTSYTQGEIHGGTFPITYMAALFSQKVSNRVELTQSEVTAFKNDASFGYIDDDGVLCAISLAYQGDDPSKFALVIVRNVLESKDAREVFLLSEAGFIDERFVGKAGGSVANRVSVVDVDSQFQRLISILDHIKQKDIEKFFVSLFTQKGGRLFVDTKRADKLDFVKDSNLNGDTDLDTIKAISNGAQRFFEGLQEKNTEILDQYGEVNDILNYLISRPFNQLEENYQLDKNIIEKTLSFLSSESNPPILINVLTQKILPILLLAGDLLLKEPPIESCYRDKIENLVSAFNAINGDRFGDEHYCSELTEQLSNLYDEFYKKASSTEDSVDDLVVKHFNEKYSSLRVLGLGNEEADRITVSSPFFSEDGQIILPEKDPLQTMHILQRAEVVLEFHKKFTVLFQGIEISSSLKDKFISIVGDKYRSLVGKITTKEDLKHCDIELVREARQFLILIQQWEKLGVDIDLEPIEGIFSDIINGHFSISDAQKAVANLRVNLNALLALKRIHLLDSSEQNADLQSSISAIGPDTIDSTNGNNDLYKRARLAGEIVNQLVDRGQDLSTLDGRVWSVVEIEALNGLVAEWNNYILKNIGNFDLLQRKTNKFYEIIPLYRKLHSLQLVVSSQSDEASYEQESYSQRRLSEHMQCSYNDINERIKSYYERDSSESLDSLQKDIFTLERKINCLELNQSMREHVIHREGQDDLFNQLITIIDSSTLSLKKLADVEQRQLQVMPFIKILHSDYILQRNVVRNEEITQRINQYIVKLQLCFIEYAINNKGHFDSLVENFQKLQHLQKLYLTTAPTVVSKQYQATFFEGSVKEIREGIDVSDADILESQINGLDLLQLRLARKLHDALLQLPEKERDSTAESSLFSTTLLDFIKQFNAVLLAPDFGELLEEDKKNISDKINCIAILSPMFRELSLIESEDIISRFNGLFRKECIRCIESADIEGAQKLVEHYRSYQYYKSCYQFVGPILQKAPHNMGSGGKINLPSDIFNLEIFNSRDPFLESLFQLQDDFKSKFRYLYRCFKLIQQHQLSKSLFPSIYKEYMELLDSEIELYALKDNGKDKEQASGPKSSELRRKASRLQERINAAGSIQLLLNRFNFDANDESKRFTEALLQRFQDDKSASPVKHERAIYTYVLSQKLQFSDESLGPKLHEIQDRLSQLRFFVLKLDTHDVLSKKVQAMRLEFVERILAIDSSSTVQEQRKSFGLTKFEDAFSRLIKEIKKAQLKQISQMVDDANGLMIPAGEIASYIEFQKQYNLLSNQSEILENITSSSALMLAHHETAQIKAKEDNLDSIDAIDGILDDVRNEKKRLGELREQFDLEKYINELYQNMIERFVKRVQACHVDDSFPTDIEPYKALSEKLETFCERISSFKHYHLSNASIDDLRQIYTTLDSEVREVERSHSDIARYVEKHNKSLSRGYPLTISALAISGIITAVGVGLIASGILAPIGALVLGATAIHFAAVATAIAGGFTALFGARLVNKSRRVRQSKQQISKLSTWLDKSNQQLTALEQKVKPLSKNSSLDSEKPTTYGKLMRLNSSRERSKSVGTQAEERLSPLGRRRSNSFSASENPQAPPKRQRAHSMSSLLERQGMFSNEEEKREEEVLPTSPRITPTNDSGE